MKRFQLVLLCAILLGGCSTWDFPRRLSGDLPRKGSLIPDGTLSLTSSLAIPLDKLMYWAGYASAAYLILDPLSPNWEIEEASFPEDTFAMSLHMKRYYAGGTGEARLVFHRRAQELMRQGGYGGYDILEYNESIESSVLGSQRMAAGTIRLTKKSG